MEDFFGLEYHGPIDHFSIEGDHGALCPRSGLQHAPGPGDLIAACAKAPVHMADLLRMDAEFSAETHLAGMRRVVNQSLGIVDRGTDAVNRRRYPRQARDQHQLRTEIQQFFALSADAEVKLQIN